MTKMLRFAAMGLAIMVLMSGCDDSSSDSSGSTAGVAGHWSGSGNYDQGTAIQTFILDLAQNGNAVSGSYSVKRTGRSQMNGSVNGSVSGSSINMTLSPHGTANGSVNGNTMSLYWYESGFGGSGGGGNVNLSR